MWFEVHYVASTQPRKIAVVLLVFVVLDLKKSLLSFFELFGRCRSETEIPVEVIIVDEVWPDRLEVDEDIIELFEDEEALSHTLSSRNSVTLGWRGADHLEEILCNS